MQTAAPEAMTMAMGEQHLSGTLPIDKYNAIGIGPGIGNEVEVADFLYNIISSCSKPLVLDADALNILSEHTDWLKQLPANSILTPHPGEFKRLFGDSANGFERLELLKKKCREYNCVIVLKGAHTAIASPDGKVYFNSTGNPGMATGGSGDVLTGIITGLLAQGYEPLEVAITGVYLHGLAGDIAAAENSMEALVAGDLVKYLGKAFKGSSH
jgi:NAD(P)H-hydrate epimerase